MNEKVKITAEQAEAIKTWCADGDIAELLEYHAEMIYRADGWLKGGFYEPLNDLDQSDMARALLIGYEVEPEYKVGEYIVYENEHLKNTMKIVSLNNERIAVEPIYEGFKGCDTISVNSPLIRHATPEEIKAEKERGWWAKQGRDVWELKQGDVLMATRREIYEVTADPKSHEFNCYTGNDEYDFDIEECKNDNWEVICFHENRKDVRHA